MLGLSLVPVLSGALAGVAAVSLGFGGVHGITLGFGTTLIGEAVDGRAVRAVRGCDATWRTAASAQSGEARLHGRGGYERNDRNGADQRRRRARPAPRLAATHGCGAGSHGRGRRFDWAC